MYVHRQVCSLRKQEKNSPRVKTKMNRDRENVGHENNTNISGHRCSWDPREKRMGGKSRSSIQTYEGETFGSFEF